MIDLAVVPEELRVGERTGLTVTLVNRGNAPCWMVAAEVQLPPTFSLFGGDRLLEVPRIGPGERATMELSVCARQEGEWELAAPDVSFHTEDGRLERLTDLRSPVRVLPRVARPSVSPPSLDLKLATREVHLDEWTKLEGTVRHEGGAAVDHLEIRLSGPVQIDRDPAWKADGGLEPGQPLQFRIPVRFFEPGEHVPLHISAVFTDVEGRPGVHREAFGVRVRSTSRAEPASADCIPILMVTANPDADGRTAKTEEEQAALIEALKRSRHPDRFALSVCPAATPQRFVASLHEVKPRIVHFAGHGTHDALIFQNDFDGEAPVESGVVAELFRLLSDHVECVVLNSCLSEATARLISKHIPFVVGMNEEIHERSARSFTAGFFEALAGDCPIDNAFEWGCVRIRVDGNPGMTTPVLFQNGAPLEVAWEEADPAEQDNPIGGAFDEQVQTE